MVNVDRSLSRVENILSSEYRKNSYNFYFLLFFLQVIYDKQVFRSMFQRIQF